jgi:Zn-finger protein
MNKYRAKAKEAWKARRLWLVCERKTAYPTIHKAYQEGQHIYQCPHCHHWHRSGAFESLAKRVQSLAKERRQERDYARRRVQWTARAQQALEHPQAA